MCRGCDFHVNMNTIRMCWKITISFKSIALIFIYYFTKMKYVIFVCWVMAMGYRMETMGDETFAVVIWFHYWWSGWSCSSFYNILWLLKYEYIKSISLLKYHDLCYFVTTYLLWSMSICKYLRCPGLTLKNSNRKLTVERSSG